MKASRPAAHWSIAALGRNLLQQVKSRGGDNNLAGVCKGPDKLSRLKLSILYNHITVGISRNNKNARLHETCIYVSSPSENSKAALRLKFALHGVKPKPFAIRVMY